MIVDGIGTQINLRDNWPPPESKARIFLQKVSDYSEIEIELENCLYIAEIMVGMANLRINKDQLHPSLHALGSISFELSKLPTTTANFDGLVVERSLECSFFVRYARPFITAQGRATIEKKVVEKTLPANLIPHHENLVETRHDHFGHATSAITRQPIRIIDSNHPVDEWQLDRGHSSLHSRCYDEQWLSKTRDCIRHFQAHCRTTAEKSFERLKNELTVDDIKLIRDGRWSSDPSGKAYEPPEDSPRN